MQVNSILIKDAKQPIDLAGLLNMCPNVRDVTVSNAHQQVILGPNSASLSSFSLQYKNEREDGKYREFNVSNLHTSAFAYRGNGNLRGSTVVDAFTHYVKYDGQHRNNGRPSPGDAVTVRTAFRKVTQNTNYHLESNTYTRPKSYATNVVMMPLATFTFKRTHRQV